MSKTNQFVHTVIAAKHVELRTVTRDSCCVFCIAGIAAYADDSSFLPSHERTIDSPSPVACTRGGVEHTHRQRGACVSARSTPVYHAGPVPRQPLLRRFYLISLDIIIAL